MTDTTSGKRPAPLRLFSMEGLFGAFALFSLATGLWRGEPTQIFWGLIILAGLIILIAVRRRDWKQHWSEMEKQADRRRDTDHRP